VREKQRQKGSSKKEKKEQEAKQREHPRRLLWQPLNQLAKRDEESVIDFPSFVAGKPRSFSQLVFYIPLFVT
jgi:hypothetical protein